MSEPLVSICIPCHDAAPYIGAAIHSILSQSWRRLEIIIVDDKSNDDSADIAKGFKDPRIRIIEASCGSAAKSRNMAFSASLGEWIKFFDADDLLHPHAIENQLLRLQGRVDAIASSGWGRFYNNDIDTFGLSFQSVWRDLPSLDWLVEAWREAEPMMQPGMFLMHRSLLELAGGWDESLSLTDDFEFFARLISHSADVLFTDDATLYYRSGLVGSLSSQTSRTAAVSAFNSLIRGTGHLLRCRSDAAARLSCANIMQQFIYTFYPAHPDLRATIGARISQLGGSDLSPSGGPWFHRIRRLVGWKAARRLQRAIGRC